MKEIWKDIPNYIGYQASNMGRIRTYNKITRTERHGERHWKDRILKPKEKIPKSHSKHQGKNGKGYAVDLWKNGKSRTFLVARLIAFTFYEKDINNRKLTVDHVDGNRLNNRLENLEIVSLKENIQRAFKKGFNKNQKKIKLQFKDCGQPIYCVSMSEACKILGKNNGYISAKIKKGIYEDKVAMWSLY